MPLIDGPDYASIAETIGLITLRALYPGLTGQGVTVGQVEGSSSGTARGIDFEVDPASLGHPADNADHFLTYISDVHGIEPVGPVSWRWTNGCPRLLVPESATTSVLEIDWAPGWLRYWQAGAREKGNWSE